MSEHLKPKGSALVAGINVFELYIYKIHERCKNEELADCPTFVWTTTLQTSALTRAL